VGCACVLLAELSFLCYWFHRFHSVFSRCMMYVYFEAVPIRCLKITAVPLYVCPSVPFASHEEVIEVYPVAPHTILGIKVTGSRSAQTNEKAVTPRECVHILSFQSPETKDFMFRERLLSLFFKCKCECCRETGRYTDFAVVNPRARQTKATGVNGVMSLALHYWMGDVHHYSGPPVSEMTHILCRVGR